MFHIVLSMVYNVLSILLFLRGIFQVEMLCLYLSVPGSELLDTA